jgi:hypothetical protein
MTQKNSPGDRPTIRCRVTDQSLLPHSCQLALGGYYKYKHRPMAPTQMRRVWLTNLIREVHAASRGTYGSRPSSCRTDFRHGSPCQLSPWWQC